MGDRRTANFDGGLLIIGSGGGGERVVVEGKTKVAYRNEEESEDDSTQIIHRRVLKASLVECLSCSLCDRLCRDASTIIECLHTFCSTCLRKRLKDGRTKNVCPKCSTDLGCHPFQLVRQDRLLSAIQMKLFPAGGGGQRLEFATRSPHLLNSQSAVVE
ncbi:unnamed protein product [Calypogeia fissa]